MCCCTYIRPLIRNVHLLFTFFFHQHRVCTTCREPKPEGMKRVSLSHCTDVSQGCPYYVDIKLLDEKMDNAWQVEMVTTTWF